jgi:hypothetical protein
MMRISSKAHGASKLNIHSKIYTWPDENARKAFGSEIHNMPRARYSKEADPSVIDFFSKTTQGWSFVAFQDKFRSIPDDEYEEGLIDAIKWCKNAYDEDSWRLIGNNFIFRHESDAASFIMRFF